MISAKKAREMIESVEQNKEALESTFGHIEKKIISACDRKDYTCIIDLTDSNLAYDVKACIGNPALRKHIVKKLEKNGFKTKLFDNKFEISWVNEEEEENNSKSEFEVSKNIKEVNHAKPKNNPEILNKIKENMDIIKQERDKALAAKPVKPVNQSKKMDVSLDGVDFSEFNDIINYKI